MNEEWGYSQWLRLEIPSESRESIGIISEYAGIKVALSNPSHYLGIIYKSSFLSGPQLMGLEFSPWMFLSITRKQENIRVHINAELALEIDDGQVLFKLDTFKVERGSGNKEPIETQDLSKWVEKRKGMFKRKAQPSKDRVSLTLEEQQNQLVGRLRALEELVQEFDKGKRFFFGDIVATLRSLLFYRSKGRNFDPLLLRIAAFKEATLPVYIPPKNEDLIGQTIINAKELPEFFGLTCATIQPEIPCILLTDFQEYLESPSLFYKGEPISPLSLIGRVADTQSTAHFDQTVPEDVEGIRSTPITFGKNHLEYYIMRLAELTLSLGKKLVESS
jgi:hypothetical protein